MREERERPAGPKETKKARDKSEQSGRQEEITSKNEPRRGSKKTGEPRKKKKPQNKTNKPTPTPTPQQPPPHTTRKTRNNQEKKKTKKKKKPTQKKPRPTTTHLTSAPPKPSTLRDRILVVESHNNKNPVGKEKNCIKCLESAEGKPLLLGQWHSGPVNSLGHHPTEQKAGN